MSQYICAAISPHHHHLLPNALGILSSQDVIKPTYYICIIKIWTKDVTRMKIIRTAGKHNEVFIFSLACSLKWVTEQETCGTFCWGVNNGDSRSTTKWNISVSAISVSIHVCLLTSRPAAIFKEASVYNFSWRGTPAGNEQVCLECHHNQSQPEVLIMKTDVLSGRFARFSLFKKAFDSSYFFFIKL